MSKKFREWLLLCSLAVLMLSLVNVAFAETNSRKNSTKKMLSTSIGKEDADTSFCILKENVQISVANDDVTSEFVNLALNSSQIQDFEKYLEETSQDFSLQVEKNYVYILNENVNVYFPLNGGDGHSYFGMIFDRKTKAVVHSMAGLFSFNLDENVQFNILLDGQMLADLILTKEGQLISGTVYLADREKIDLSKLDQTEAASGFWSCVTDCLAAAGVPLYLIGGLSIVCSAVCVVTAGLACGICFSVALGAWAGVGAACWALCA